MNQAIILLEWASIMMWQKLLEIKVSMILFSCLSIDIPNILFVVYMFENDTSELPVTGMVMCSKEISLCFVSG